jgi:ubiquinone biosynthesis monooxygenase Coq7
MTAKKKPKAAAKKKRSLPGDRPGTRQQHNSTTPRDHDIASIIRVNHAGEYGAKQIYAGQLAVLGKKDPKIKKLLEHMAEQELKHLEYFENQIVTRQTRPSALQPFWHVAGYAVGYLTAKMGTEAAMACTVAVEHVIADHYGDQLEALKDNKEERALYNAIKQFKAEEEEHHDIGIEEDAEQAPAYKLLSFLIGKGSKLAIEVAKRV